MKDLIWFNNEIIETGTATISAMSAAALYGKGIFTTAAVNGSDIFLWEKHWRRLTANAETLGIDISGYSEKFVAESATEVLAVNGITDGRLRITFFDRSSSGLWQTSDEKGAHLLITAAEKRRVKNSLKLTVSAFRVNSASPLAGIKSCNYLENLMAFESAQSGGSDEAIRLNERGEITSGCFANIFWQKGGDIFTPSLDTGCLPGTTREHFMENNRCIEIQAEIKELFSADRIFMTSAGIGVADCALDLDAVE